MSRWLVHPVGAGRGLQWGGYWSGHKLFERYLYRIQGVIIAERWNAPILILFILCVQAALESYDEHNTAMVGNSVYRPRWITTYLLYWCSSTQRHCVWYDPSSWNIKEAIIQDKAKRTLLTNASGHFGSMTYISFCSTFIHNSRVPRGSPLSSRN